MPRHAPMHVNPGHPLWRRIPLGVACFLFLAMGAYLSLALAGDAEAWAGAVLTAPVAALYSWGYWAIRKEQRDG